MASSITKSYGKMPSAPLKVCEAVVDFTDIDSYATGGHEDSVLSAEIEGWDFISIPRAATNGTTIRWFKVNSADKKVQSFTDETCATETTAADDLSGYTAIPVQLIGE